MTPIIRADWPAPKNIVALTTTRINGASKYAYARFNLAQHVGDNSEHVDKNRDQLQQQLNLPQDPAWLTQYHSDQVIEVTPDYQPQRADASFSRCTNQVCAVLTADCLPILLCNQRGNEVAAIHAGWRGLANGIIEKTVAQLRTPKHQVLAWLGPGIGANAFVVGCDVYEAFTKKRQEAKQSFVKIADKKWLMDSYQLASLQLRRCGIEKIYGGNYCTYTNEERFFSYRRDGVTGRMASLIYFN